ncbi:hypothetical protein [Chryseobacterium arthrosphaerae]|uniref:Uncharacterized protein n=1 Tax=Chryseobacterium arthrosphaerae TaxID=651561 RepID=A0A1B8ZSC8_9FLAO|nr:hypothetical protein [Chryseobacterium arthrosphaerae]OCA74483.1 hypothetical protein BBI00_09155 [Chryseobacterium arthrosphaerae]
MKKLNPGYFKFFFFRYGIIVILVFVVSILIYCISKEEDDPVKLAFPNILALLFFILICVSEYRMLEKNLPPADVFLTDDGLIINGISYSSGQIEELTYMPVRNTLNKFPSYFFEIKTSDGAVFYFLDRDPSWNGESAVMKLLNGHPLFASKTKRREESSEGFSVFKKQKQL